MAVTSLFRLFIQSRTPAGGCLRKQKFSQPLLLRFAVHAAVHNAAIILKRSLYAEDLLVACRRGSGAADPPCRQVCTTLCS